MRSGTPLKPGLRVYFEYSNETWNGMFKQAHYACAEGDALGLNPTPRFDGKGEDWIAGYRFHAWAAIRIFRALDLVYGEDSPVPVKVLATHSANSSISLHHLDVLRDRRWNPWGVRATAIAAAPYFGHKVNGGDVDAVQQLRETIARSAGQGARLRKIADSAGLRLIAYEGGQHIVRGASRINRDPVMYDLYSEYLAAMSEYFDHFSHYCHVGGAGGGGAWGALERTGQPVEEAHKYRALVDFARSNPRKPLTGE
jgi:hypothetical protein